MLIQSRSVILKLPSHLSRVEDTQFSLELVGVPAKEAATLTQLSHSVSTP